MIASLRSFALSLAALAGCATVPACAQPAPVAAAPVTSAPVAEPAAPADADARPALWAVSDADTTIYLFGTIHVLPEGVDWLDGAIADAFARSDTLVTEIGEEDPAQVQAILMDKGVLPAGKSLRDSLAPDRRAAFERALAQFAMPVAAFDRFEPWYAAVALSSLPLMKEGYSQEHGVEIQLETRAKARALPHVGLETSAYQLSLFDDLPVDVQQRYLGEVIDQVPTIRNDLVAMVEAWKAGRAEELARLMNAEESDPVLVKTLLTDRNAAWASWIAKRLETPGEVFMAVGAGHLAGPGSVQDQLAGRGIETRRLQ